MRLCASLFRGVAAPLGCVIFSVSALPEAFFFGYSGAIFERSKVSFH